MLEQFRHFVERGGAQEASEAREADGIGRIAGRHRTKLDHAEGAFTESGAFLHEENRSAFDQPHREGRQQQHRQPHGRGHKNGHYVEEAFHGDVLLRMTRFETSR